jgi:hypothetical protein
MGVSFPEFHAWHDQAVADRWGLADYQPWRLADLYRPEPPRKKRPKNG